MRTMVYILSSISLLVFTISGLALDAPRPDESAKPWAMMQKLSPLVGSWRMTRERTFDNGKSWTVYPPSTVKLAYNQKGLLLEQQPIGGDEDGFHLAIFTSYDQYQGVYWQAAIEDYWGLMDISEGQLVDGALIYTNTESQTYYPMEKGRLGALRLTVELKSPLRFVRIEESYDGGVSWAKAFRIRYEKLPVSPAGIEKMDNHNKP